MLTPEREKEIRYAADECEVDRFMVKELLAQIDSLRLELSQYKEWLSKSTVRLELIKSKVLVCADLHTSEYWRDQAMNELLRLFIYDP